MKTIFAHSPTNPELKELFGLDTETDSMTYGFSIFKLPIKNYQTQNTLEGKLLDLALLFELRGQFKEAKRTWKKIPEIYQQYRCGFDNLIIKR